MPAKIGWSLVWGAIVASCFLVPARRAAAANCALYARAVTGVDLYGAAGGWWDQAAGLYGRGQAPAIGSILVFRRTGRIPSGHVAVVSKVIGPNEILVDHANWFRGTVSHDMPVIDTSPNHDWTMVAVLEPRSGQLGSDYPTYGFVYPQSGPRAGNVTLATAGYDANPAPGGVSWGGPAMFRFITDDRFRSSAAHRRYGGHRRAVRHSAGSAANIYGPARGRGVRRSASPQPGGRVAALDGYPAAG